MGAENEVPYSEMKTQSVQMFSFKRGVGQNRSLLASSATRNSTVLNSIFPVDFVTLFILHPRMKMQRVSYLVGANHLYLPGCERLVACRTCVLEPVDSHRAPNAGTCVSRL